MVNRMTPGLELVAVAETKENQADEPAEKRPRLLLGLVSLAEPAEELSDGPAEKRMYRRHRLPRHRPCPSSPRG